MSTSGSAGIMDASVPTAEASTPSAGPKPKRKRKTKTYTIAQFTIRDPPWCYLRLQHLSSPASRAALLDAVTAHLHLNAALAQFLGLYGTAIPIDILKLQGQDVWLRIPREDRSAFVAAVGGWTGRSGEGWTVKGWSSWNANATARNDGQDLFGEV